MADHTYSQLLSTCQAIQTALTKQINGSTAMIADVNAFVSATQTQCGRTHYKTFPEQAKALIQCGLGKHPGLTESHFLRLAIMAAAMRTLEKRVLQPLPERLKKNQIEQITRIAETIDQDHSWLSLGQDMFQKEFGITSERLFAAGAQLVDPNCGYTPTPIYIHSGKCYVAPHRGHRK